MRASAPSVKPKPSPEVARPPVKSVPENSEPRAPSVTARAQGHEQAIESHHTSAEFEQSPERSTSARALPSQSPEFAEPKVVANKIADGAIERATERATDSAGSGDSNLAQLGEQWQNIVRQLGLKAYARQLPYQSELIELSATRMVLRCDKASLATDDNALKSLREHLDRYFSERNQPVPMLQVHIADAGQVRFSPQKLASQAREAHLAQARAAIHQHPTIQQIVHEFDGMILPNSIMPESEIM